MVNDYSSEWFSIFLDPIQLEQTSREIDFLVRHLPQPAYRSVMDLGCGTGRHSNLLALQGYQVTGLDINPQALAKARTNAPAGADFINHDMRQLDSVPGNFNAVVSLWQSFGYFDEASNQDILRQTADKLTLNGRLILDIYHREFFERHQGERHFERGGVQIIESKSMLGNRLRVRLAYQSLGREDVFEWQLYYPDELIELIKGFGLQCVVACTEFDEAKPASKDSPRVQYVFQRVE